MTDTWLFKKTYNEIKQKLTWVEIKTKKEKNRGQTPNALASMELPTCVAEHEIIMFGMILYYYFHLKPVIR